jgi:hypothetical protein
LTGAWFSRRAPAKTKRSVTHNVFDEPAAENASRGVRSTSTMIQMLNTITPKTNTKPTTVHMAAPAE